MKNHAMFLAVCTVVFALTLFLLAMIILNITDALQLTTKTIMIIWVLFLVSIGLSFICSCILQTISNELKARRIKNNAKWKRS